MRKITVLSTALLLTLALAAPAAAAKTVFEFKDLSFGPDEEQVIVCQGPNDPEGCWDFDCGDGNPLFYGSYGTESLKWWYAKGMTPFVDPWFKGQYRRDGVDYFSTREDMGGRVVSGRFGFTSHLYDPVWVYDDIAEDTLPSWTETVSGKFWGIHLPGYGPIFHEAGNIRQSAQVMAYEDDGVIEYYVDYGELRDMRGASKFDVDALCSALGY